MKKNKLSLQIYAVTVIGILFLSAYFIYTDYTRTLSHKENETLSQLQGIAKTLSLSINGDNYKLLMDTYSEKDMIASSTQDSIYQSLHLTLKQAKALNNINTPIYTLTYIPENSNFEFGVTSSNTPYFRHIYTDFPEALVNNYNNGGVIPTYQDENGSWLSAFYPIKTSDNKVVGVVQIDKLFVDFSSEARGLLTNQILISLAILLVLVVALYPFLQLILKREQEFVNTLEDRVEQRTKELNDQKKTLDTLYREQKSSLVYAKKIQDSISSYSLLLKKHFKNSFVLIQPKEVVNGDFLWYRKVGDKNVLVTGESASLHGVPGAFITLIINNLLQNIVVFKKVTSPDEILNLLHQGFINILNQKNSTNREMVHASICVFDSNKLTFSGANTSALVVEHAQHKLLDGNKMSIGGFNFDLSKKFGIQTEKISSGAKIYLYSDGMNNQLFSNNDIADDIEQLVEQNLSLPIDKLGTKLTGDLSEWKENKTQVDDVLIVGVEID